jgi:Putative peptidoglycan binding domain
MGLYYTAKQGDCLSSIAEEYGFVDYKSIYLAPENESFREKRPNPNIIFPGDILFIPDRTSTEFPRPTDQMHLFCLKREKVYLRICLEDDLQQPFRNKRYRLRVGHARFQGTTDARGMVEKRISPRDSEGEITVFPLENDPSDPGYTFQLNLGHIDPIDETSGVDARLINLGFGPPDHQDTGLSDEERSQALKAFQDRVGLDVNGQPDETTRRKLSQLHDGE